MQAQRIGGFVAGQLAQGRANIRMLARFSRHVYLEIGETLLVLNSHDATSGPLTVHLTGLPDWLGDGVMSGGVMQFDGGVVDLAPAAIWPSEVVARDLPSVERLAGLAGDIPHGSDLLATVLDSGDPADAGLVALMVGLRDGGARRLEVAAQSLIGRGPGLTPAGDDALAGAAMAAWAFRLSAAQALADAVLPVVETGTTRLSGAFLKAALAGHGPESWHRLVRGLPDPEPADVAAVMAPGHSSGADTLAGLLLACRAFTVSRG